MGEVVHLVGGPADGMQISIRHGDTIRMAQRAEPLDFSSGSRGDVPVLHQDVEYRRSAVEPRRFIYQPPPGSKV